MKKLQKIGAWAAFYAAAAYLLGFVLWIAVLGYSSDLSAAQKIVSFVENQDTWYFLNLVVYILWGFDMVILSLALHDRLNTRNSAMMQISTAIGLIWSGLVIASGMISNIGIKTVVGLNVTDPTQAAIVWAAIDAVRDGLGGGNEIVGGIWITLVSIVALKGSEFSKVLNYLGLLIGAAGILSAIPFIADLASVFGLLQIVWFIWLGLVISRKEKI